MTSGANNNKPKILAVRSLAHSRFFHIEELYLQFANGETRYFERLKPRGTEAVLVVPFLDDETVLLIREYGAGIEDYYLALPKGLIDQGEQPLEAANRELKEEVGYGSQEMTEVRSIASSPGYNSNVTRIVVAKQLYPEDLPGDEPESIEVVPWSIHNLSELMARTDFNESRSIAAIYIVRDWVHERQQTAFD